jgi:membrane fusion protein (multidrug efflux system)
VIYYDSYPATTVALKQVELRSNVTGYITQIYFKEGEPVAKGEKLYEIDRSKYQASYEQAKNNVAIAQANLDRVKRDADRYEELNKQDAIAKQRLDDAMTALKNAQFQVASAKEDLVKASTDLNYSLITAPFNGTIGISSVRLGTLVSPGQTLLNIISSDDPMGVDFVINENELMRFQKLEQKPLNKNDSTFKVLLSDNTYFQAHGHISIIDRAIDPQTGTIKIRLDFPNAKRALKAGMSCNVKVLNENSGSQVIIPYKAVVEQMGEYFVYVAKDKKANQVKISLGTKLGQNIIVQNGIEAGQVIVTDGVQKLHNGSVLQLAMPKTAGIVNYK